MIKKILAGLVVIILIKLFSGLRGEQVVKDSILPELGMTAEIPFDSLFEAVSSTQYIPKLPVRVGGFTMTGDAVLNGFAKVNGATLQSLKGKTLIIRNVSGVVIIESVADVGDVVEP